MRRRRGGGAPGLAALGLAGALAGACAPGRLAVGAAEWDAYRGTRVAPTEEARLIAAASYLEAFPEGEFAERVAEDFDQAELLFWRVAEKDRAGLERYLSALPRGPHAREAAERLAVLARAAGARRAEQGELREQGRDLEERLADAAAYRREFVRAFAGWVGRLATVQSFGRGTPELPHPVIHAFRLSDPRGRCADDTCRKPLEFGYAIPDGGRLRARRALLDVTFRLDRGRLREVELGGPELFSRLGEALLLTPLTPDDGAGRRRAVERVLRLIEAQIDGEFPAGRCAVGAPGGGPAPGVTVLLRRACAGRELLVTASGEDTEDRVVVRALPAAPRP